ncbi:MAG: DUF2189 domain-containing protein [Hyphomicrobiaceae bacterium]
MTSIAEAISRRKPTIAGVAVRDVSLEAPWSWVEAGWQDLWVHPHISFTYGAVFAVLAVAMFVGMTLIGLQSLILALAGGFVLIGPAIAVGIYELSRQIERGELATFSSLFSAAARAPGQLGFLGAILAFFYIVWLETALLLFMLFMGASGSFPPASQFITVLLYEPHGLALLVVGTVVGSLLASAVFSISVVSVPLLLTRQIDAVSAIHVSVAAVAQNFRPMALWAALIAVIIGIGLLTCFVGLVVAFPLLGHASWHVFRDTLEVSETER